MIDLRSDTVTKPTPEMLQAMADEHGVSVSELVERIARGEIAIPQVEPGESIASGC